MVVSMMGAWWMGGVALAGAQEGEDPAPADPVDVEPVRVEEGDVASGDLEADAEAALNSEGQNLFGGRLTDATTLTLSTGFPHGLAVGVRARAGDVELAPQVVLDYGRAFGASAPSLGTGFDLGMRVGLLHRGAWDVALRMNVGGDVAFTGGVALGLDLLDPGVRASVNVADVVDVDFGFDVLPQLRFVPGSPAVGFNMAFPLMFGVEGDVAPGVQVGFTTRAGPAAVFVAGPGGAAGGVGPCVETLLHVGASLGNLRR